MILRASHSPPPLSRSKPQPAQRFMSAQLHRVMRHAVLCSSLTKAAEEHYLYEVEHTFGCEIECIKRCTADGTLSRAITGQEIPIFPGSTSNDTFLWQHLSACPRSADNRRLHSETTVFWRRNIVGVEHLHSRFALAQQSHTGVLYHLETSPNIRLPSAKGRRFFPVQTYAQLN